VDSSRSGDADSIRRSSPTGRQSNSTTSDIRPPNSSPANTHPSRQGKRDHLCSHHDVHALTAARARRGRRRSGISCPIDETPLSLPFHAIAPCMNRDSQAFGGTPPPRGRRDQCGSRAQRPQHHGTGLLSRHTLVSSSSLCWRSSTSALHSCFMSH
jgi:hypothetical protein